MTPLEIAKVLSSAAVTALGEGIAAAIESESLDVGFARMIEKLSDTRLAGKVFPDGRYVPPE